MARIMRYVDQSDGVHWVWKGHWSKPYTRTNTVFHRRAKHALDLQSPAERRTYNIHKSYPQLKIDGQMRNVRRYLYCYPEVPDTKVYVRVACLHPLCVRPDHLRVTLAADMRTGERPVDPRMAQLDPNIVYLIQAFRDGSLTPADALKFGATEAQVREAQGRL